jgi:hypothetical protein
LLKFFLIYICFIFGIKAANINLCSKDSAEKKVSEICREIETNLEVSKKKWPNSLLYKNCGNNYVWIQGTSSDLKMIMHPIKQRLNGAYIGNLFDENRLPLFKTFDREAKKHPEGVWVDYSWPKPDEEKGSPKTSFVKKCKLQNGDFWVVGSGIWKADLKKN